MDRKRNDRGLRGMLKGSATNRGVTPNVCAEVWHVGMNDYRVIFVGIGEHSAHHQLSPAFSTARRLAAMSQADLNHEIARVQNKNDQAAAIDC